MSVQDPGVRFRPEMRMEAPTRVIGTWASFKTLRPDRVARGRSAEEDWGIPETKGQSKEEPGEETEL